MAGLKRAVIFGAGCIGRGFIGQLLAESGYSLCYLEIKGDLIAALNRRGEYPLRLVAPSGEAEERVIGPVRALDAASQEAVSALADCDLAATAVGAGNLPAVAPVIAAGARLRKARDGGPLNVLLCENQMDVHRLMHGLVYAHLFGEERAWADENLGLVEPSVGRTVPRPSTEMAAQDPLLLCAEPYAELPADRAGFRGKIPEITGLRPDAPFDYYIRRKLFVHNGGHAACAYLAARKGLTYIWQGAEDHAIRAAVMAVMEVSARALGAAYGEEKGRDAHCLAADLSARFASHALGDTVVRVGADPARKLRREDRLIGAALFALAQGIDPAPLMAPILAALEFAAPGDPSAPRVRQLLEEQGIDAVLTRVMGLRPGEGLYGRIKSAYDAAQSMH